MCTPRRYSDATPLHDAVGWHVAPDWKMVLGQGDAKGWLHVSRLTNTGLAKRARASVKGYRLLSSVLFMFDYDVIAGAQTETQGQGSDESEVGKVKLVDGVSAGNLVEFALVTTTTRNKGSGSRRCRRSARVVFPLSRTGVQVEPWRSLCYRR